jgi:DNA polymerase-3 subunit epsilon/ATP-dependent DNA helicase DinG
MSRTIVALDLETTGLDSSQDEIIEIGAVKFNHSRVIDEYQTLINPTIRIPPAITRLTGITDAMVRGAPHIEQVLDRVSAFVGDLPVLGHNISFDLGFMRKHDQLRRNPSLDTYEMAAVALPGAGRYNLSALGQALNVIAPATHRALDDARVTRAVYLRLYEMLLDLPYHLVQEIVRLGRNVRWDGNLPFRWALEELSDRSNASASTVSYQNPLYSLEPPGEHVPLDLPERPQPLERLEVTATLEPGGKFFDHFPGYEHRPEQVAMLESATRAISEGRHLLIEAGTGIGKSLAYLIPAAAWAVKNNSRVVISTNTINLQDQLISQDIPELTRVLELDLKSTVLKGRANYLCPHHLETLRKAGPKNADEMRVLGKVLHWIESSQTGDRGEINLNGSRENRIWHRISADQEGCSADGCRKRTGGRCPFYRVRQSAHSAHLIVVNHALLLADVSTGNRILPEYDTLVVDEAHHLESATTNALSFYSSQGLIRRSLAALGDERKGVLGWIVDYGQDQVSPSESAALEKLIKSLTDRAFKVESRVDEFFRALDDFMRDQRSGRPIGRYTQQERILTSTRTQPSWINVEISWDQGRQSLNALLEELQHLWEAVSELIRRSGQDSPRLEATLSDLREAHREIYEFFENLDALVFEPREDMIYWVEAHPHRRSLAVQAAPLHIGELMEKHIWYEKRAVILTSATLTTTGDFDYIRGRLQAVDAEELKLGSPFDYQNSALLYLVNNIPEPTDRHGHQKAIDRGLIELCKATGGRTLVLFTSYAQLSSTARAITGPLAQEGIIVYEQGSGPSPHTLLDSFREADQAVLLGTRAFWEGIDVPGPDLSVLVIAKLPFDVPSDPIISARAETFQNPFQEYMLPEAILSFRQGFGRLIRSKQDLGVVISMDRRLLTKNYGPLFLSSLPNPTIQEGRLQEVTERTVRWLNI